MRWYKTGIVNSSNGNNIPIRNAEGRVGDQGPDRRRALGPHSRGAVPERTEKPLRPPVAWFVVATMSWVLIVTALIATVVGGSVSIIALGIPGAVGFTGVGLWLRRNRDARPT
jgi:hypothetical protein